MLEHVYEVLSPMLHPVAANEGDLVVLVRTPDCPALITVWRPGRGLLRQRFMSETVATGSIFAAMNDDLLNEIDLRYDPSNRGQGRRRA